MKLLPRPTNCAKLIEGIAVGTIVAGEAFALRSLLAQASYRAFSCAGVRNTNVGYNEGLLVGV
jgi:hypothetical protein